MGRRIFGGAVLLTWLAMVGWQVRRVYFQPELARLAEAARSLAPGVSFYTLTMNGHSVGQATSRLDTVPEGFELDDLMSLRMPALGQTGTAVARTRVDLTRSLVMRSFAFSLDSDVGRFEATGTLDADTTLSVTLRSAGSEQKLHFRMEQPPVFSSVVPIRVAMGNGLAVGSSIRLPVFDPTTMGTQTVEVRVLDHDTVVVPDSAALDASTGRWSPAHYDSIPAWRIAEVFGGVTVDSWVDEDGRILRSSSPLGFSMEKTEYELARQSQQDEAQASGSGAAGGDVILSTAVRSNVDLSDAQQYDEIRYLLSGTDLEGFALDGGRQELRGDTVIVRRERWNRLDPGYRLPYPRMDLRDALEPEPLIQSDDPRIIKKAREITAWRSQWRLDPKQTARQLTRSVYGMIDKKVTFSVPNAVQVLDARRGDCNEHTVLFVALARSLGLPARTAVGLVWVNGAFYYHAWPEVWLGRWVAVDPTFGQVPADASHIRFVIGGLADQVEIVRLIGNLHIDVLDRRVAAADRGGARLASKGSP
ncbi:MAG: transglutaminase-like domain-containing protein [Gemmatimonadetes bacterium]|nr:transglutaminase-like domain-containing protein [Gemmatimonadota bacterium]